MFLHINPPYNFPINSLRSYIFPINSHRSYQKNKKHQFEIARMERRWKVTPPKTHFVQTKHYEPMTLNKISLHKKNISSGAREHAMICTIYIAKLLHLSSLILMRLSSMESLTNHPLSFHDSNKGKPSPPPQLLLWPWSFTLAGPKVYTYHISKTHIHIFFDTELQSLGTSNWHTWKFHDRSVWSPEEYAILRTSSHNIVIR